MTIARSSRALLVALGAVLALSACSGTEDPEPADPTAAVDTDTPGDPAAAVPDGVPETQACGLLSEEEAAGFLELPLGAPPEGLYQAIIGTANCTWTASNDSTFRAIQASITRTGWVSPALADQTPEVTAEYLWEQNSIPQELDGEAVEPLFFLDRPGPEGLGQQSYFSPIGLCVLESTDLWWCVSAGGITTDTESPEAQATMVAMAELVDTRIPESPTGQPAG